MAKAERPYLTELREWLRPHRGGVFLEWGSGFSTAILADVGREVYTIDHHAEYQAQVRRAFGELPNVRWILADLTGPTRSEEDAGLAYSSAPLGMGVAFDVAVIDGRDRVACAATASFLGVRLILLHDFRRARYRPVESCCTILGTGVHYRAFRPNA